MVTSVAEKDKRWQGEPRVVVRLWVSVTENNVIEEGVRKKLLERRMLHPISWNETSEMCGSHLSAIG